MKAAVARLLTGDATGASKIAGQYFDARKTAKDQTVDYRLAQWTWITGHRKDAMREMEAFARGAEKSQRDNASLAWTELSLWNLMLGDRTAAAQLAQKALSIASQASAGNAFVARFLSMPPAQPSEWAARAEQQFPGPGLANMRNLALAYALLGNRQFAAAQPLLQQMWDNGAPMAGEGLPVVLAWSYLETGKTPEAGALLRQNPIPPRTGVEPYTTFYLPRLFYLRGLVAEKEGRGGEAKEQYRKFLELSGPDPLEWGEEKKAGAGR
jgi:tetratricopeptide (TPR) repeat protein